MLAMWVIERCSSHVDLRWMLDRVAYDMSSATDECNPNGMLVMPSMQWVFSYDEHVLAQGSRDLTSARGAIVCSLMIANEARV